MRRSVRTSVEPVAELHPGPAPARGGTAGPALDLTPAAVAELGATHGNQAVLALLRATRSPDGPTLARLKLTPAEIVAKYDAAVGASDWDKAAQMLVQLPEATVVEKLRALTPDQRTKIESATGRVAPKKSDVMRKRIHFVETGPSFGEHSEYTVTDEGDRKHKGKVKGGGTVTVRTDVAISEDSSTENFTIGYEGVDADKSAWLQFIWREIVVEHPTKKRFRVDEEITTTGGTYRLTTDPSKPSYNTDSASASTPFYEDAGFSERTSDSTTILDEPSPMKHLVDAQLDDGATKVTSRAHFSTYLIRDMKVLYKVDIDVEWVYTDKTTPPRKHKVPSAGAASGLKSGQRKRLLEQWPKFDWVP